MKFVSGFFLVLLFLGALFWAKEQDPFSRKWFMLKTADRGSLKCVAVLSKPLGQFPVVIYAHGSGGTLMNDGNDLRQIAELGLAVVSLEYDQTNGTVFATQFEALLRYLDRQKWANTNAIAWVGFSLGANRMLDFALQHPAQQPQLLVQMSGAGVPEGQDDSRLKLLRCPVLLVHGEQDEVFPLADIKRLASILQAKGLPTDVKIIPGASHGVEPERGVVFRSIGEYCLTHLAGKDAWQHYHSIAQWQAKAPLWLFWIPAMAWAGIWLLWRLLNGTSSIPVGQSCRSAPISPPASATMPTGSPAKTSLGSFWRKFGRRGNGALPWGLCPLKRSEIALRWLAVILATWALTETAIHLVTPHFSVTDTTLSTARRFLVQPKERADFENLAAQSIWHNQRLKILLVHAELAGYNRELVNWQVDEKNYQEFVLSPVITGDADEKLSWRRPLWEEFYPRIRHESLPEDAAKIVMRHLRERVTIVAAPGLPHEVPAIWLRQITDKTGFEIIYVAALRSVGVPARLNSQHQAEFWDGTKWDNAPRPSVVSW
jgi:predicted esterase